MSIFTRFFQKRMNICTQRRGHTRRPPLAQAKKCRILLRSAPAEPAPAEPACLGKAVLVSYASSRGTPPRAPGEPRHTSTPNQTIAFCKSSLVSNPGKIRLNDTCKRERAPSARTSFRVFKQGRSRSLTEGHGKRPLFRLVSFRLAEDRGKEREQ